MKSFLSNPINAFGNAIEINKLKNRMKNHQDEIKELKDCLEKRNEQQILQQTILCTEEQNDVLLTALRNIFIEHDVPFLSIGGNVSTEDLMKARGEAGSSSSSSNFTTSRATPSATRTTNGKQERGGEMVLDMSDIVSALIEQKQTTAGPHSVVDVCLYKQMHDHLVATKRLSSKLLNHLNKAVKTEPETFHNRINEIEGTLSDMQLSLTKIRNKQFGDQGQRKTNGKKEKEGKGKTVKYSTNNVTDDIDAGDTFVVFEQQQEEVVVSKVEKKREKVCEEVNARNIDNNDAEGGERLSNLMEKVQNEVEEQGLNSTSSTTPDEEDEFLEENIEQFDSVEIEDNEWEFADGKTSPMKQR